uniref:Uncharacterized protein n=1 Tax=Lepeophtheirus salmonis TaxID=72036 RepID=A0A0K2TVE2_LEPSM
MNPMKSVRKMDLKVYEKTVRRRTKDLRGISYVRRRRQLLTEVEKVSRIEKGTNLLSCLKTDRSTFRVFSDEKIGARSTLSISGCGRCEFAGPEPPGLWGAIEKKACATSHHNVGP